MLCSCSFMKALFHSFFNTMHPYFDYIPGLMLLKRNRQYVDTEDTSLGSFDCSKGNIDTRITGSWDESLPPMTIPRCMATAVTLGLYHTRKELLDYLNLWQKFRGGSNDTPLPTPLPPPPPPPPPLFLAGIWGGGGGVSGRDPKVHKEGNT